MRRGVSVVCVLPIDCPRQEAAAAAAAARPSRLIAPSRRPSQQLHESTIHKEKAEAAKQRRGCPSCSSQRRRCTRGATLESTRAGGSTKFDDSFDRQLLAWQSGEKLPTHRARTIDRLPPSSLPPPFFGGLHLGEAQRAAQIQREFALLPAQDAHSGSRDAREQSQIMNRIDS